MSNDSHPVSPEVPFADETVYLWPDGSANNGSHPDYRPKLRFHYPGLWSSDYESRRFPVMIVCPGGGYNMQATHEGQPFAQLFAMHGIVAPVLTYRVKPDLYPAPFADIARAIRFLRAHAAHYSLDPDRIGVIGFSAGGHLCSVVSTQPDYYADPQDDLASTVSARPDRAVLGYPVTDMSGPARAGMRAGILGDATENEQSLRLSTALQVTPETPPTFLFHTANDEMVPVDNSIRYTQACLDNGVPVELHMYQDGRHGVGMALGNPRLKGWTQELISWLGDWINPVD